MFKTESVVAALLYPEYVVDKDVGGSAPGLSVSVPPHDARAVVADAPKVERVPPLERQPPV